MIRKFLSIKDVAVFDDCQAKGNVEFGKLTLVYGENARGKSTLTAILRSLRENDPVLIKERSRLGSTEPPEVAVLTESGRLSYQNGAWNAVCPDLEIFDSEFVQANVFRGDKVEHGQKQNLYRFVIGETGVSLAKQVDDLDEGGRAVQQEITSLKKEIEKQILSGLTVEDFLGLPKDEGIAATILQQQRELDAVKRASDILAKPELTALSMPELPLEEIGGVLGKGVEELCADAERRTKAHIAACLDAEGEAWLRKGVGYIKEDQCPFCGRPLGGVALVEAYRGYFSEAYRQLKEEAQGRLAEVQGLLGEFSLLAIQEVILSNERLREFWEAIVPGAYPEPERQEISRLWHLVRTELARILDRKVASPAEIFEPKATLEQAGAMVRELNELMKAYNAQAAAANKGITTRKKSLVGANVAAAERQLQWLQDCRNRHSGPLAEQCEKLARAQADKRRLEAEKTRAKEQLGKYSRGVFAKYGQQIKGYLSRFGANFGIARVRTGFQAGRPRLEYCIELRNRTVDLDAKAAGTPCFRNTLSSGDRSTLALAFFLARLTTDTDTASKVVVLDDPITSLDGSRRFQTHQEIRELLGHAAQVVVLSHDPNFLRQLWENTAAADRKALKLAASGEGSQLTECDLVAETRSQYHKDYDTLANFRLQRTADDALKVARSIRPVLEGYLRVRYPYACRPHEWLGDYEKNIHEAPCGSDLSGFQPYLPELRAIREYCSRYHHPEQNQRGSQPIDLGELHAYVERTLRLISGTTLRAAGGT